MKPMPRRPLPLILIAILASLAFLLIMLLISATTLAGLHVAQEGFFGGVCSAVAEHYGYDYEAFTPSEAGYIVGQLLVKALGPLFVLLVSLKGRRLFLLRGCCVLWVLFAPLFYPLAALVLSLFPSVKRYYEALNACDEVHPQLEGEHAS